MNIRELDEESRRTGVWPPRRIILRVEPEGADAEPPADGRPAPVKVADVDLAAPRAAAAPPTPRPAPAPLPSPSPAPSVTPSRRPGLPGARGVTPAAAPEDEAFDKWLAEPIADSDPEYQPPPVWLPEDVRVRAERKHRRLARRARTQLFGASAATTLAIAGCAAALGLVGLSQTETVGGSLGLPSIGLFGTHPEPSSNETADRGAAKPAAPKRADRKPAARRRERSAPPARRARTRRATSLASARGSAPSASSRRRAPAARRAPARAVVNPPAPVRQRRAASPPPPPPVSRPRAPAPTTTASRPQSSAPVAPSRPAGSTPSRPAPSAPPAGDSTPSLASGPGL